MLSDVALTVAAGTDGRAGRRDRQRQEHAGQPGREALPADGGAGRRRRPRPRGRVGRVAAPPHRLRHAGQLSLRGHRRRQHPRRAAGRQRRRACGPRRGRWTSRRLIDALPGGFATEVGEGGTRLSLGQRQVICFARAMIADPRILILDEATSSVDVLTETRMQAALAACGRGAPAS